MKVTSLAKESLMDLKKNPIVLLPDVVYFFIIAIVNLLFYKIAKFGEMIEKFSLIQEQYVSDPSNIAQFGSFFANDWLKFIISITIFVIITFFIGVGFQAIKLLLIKSVIRKGDSGSLRLLVTKRKRKYYFKLAFVKFFVFLINVSLVIVILALTLISNVLNITTPVKIITIGLFAILLTVFIRLGLLYRYAVLFLSEKRKSRSAIINSFKFALDNGKHVFIIGAFVVFIGLIFGLLNLFFVRLLDLLVIENILLISLFTFLIYMVGKVYNAWVDLVLFNDYELKGKK